MYERKNEEVASVSVFYGRMFKQLLLATLFLVVCLGIGVVGYHYTGSVSWIDSVHNASMILSGMGPVADIKGTGGKLFSSAYALFSGLAFVGAMFMLLAPAVHRIYHRFHADDND